MGTINALFLIRNQYSKPMDPISDPDSVFHKPDKPKNSLQLISWAIFEPLLLQRYSKTLSRKQGFVELLKTYPWLILIATLVYLLSAGIILVLDLPTSHPDWFKPLLVKNLTEYSSIEAKTIAYIQYTAPDFYDRLALGLAGGLGLGLAGFLVFGFAFDLIVVLAAVLIAGFASSVASGYAEDLAFGLIAGLALGLAGGLALGLAGGLALGLACSILAIGLAGFFYYGFAGFLVFGLAYGLAIAFGFFITYFRLPFFPIYCIQKVSFKQSPYHRDGVIWLPIWRAKQRLGDLAMADPQTALKFVEFLREYRPLQQKLADTLTYAALAGFWRQQPLQWEALAEPIVENAKLQPSKDWLDKLKQLKAELQSYSLQSNISLKKASFATCVKQLENFKQQTLVENRQWREYYLQAINDWLKQAQEQLRELDQQALTLEPITANVYVPGEALRPDINRAVFLGRTDLKDQFARKVLTAPSMPLFLIHGQRRTGKTSLLNFLQPLLGSGFKIIYQDLQDSKYTRIGSWLEDLRGKIAKLLDLPAPTFHISVHSPLPIAGSAAILAAISAGETPAFPRGGERLPFQPDDWLADWQFTQDWLTQISAGLNYKLILAFDEYECLHTLLQQNPQQGGRLLAALRSFSQHQNKVVFLFVGAAFFSELDNPNWNEYFVHAQRFPVDYLNHDDSIKLITEPVNLNYPQALSERMYQLTQGHPALLQLLCEKMVDIANQDGKRTMVEADLESVVNSVVNDRDTAPMSIFWTQFCQTPASKHTVKQILNGESPPASLALFRLEEHQFIVKRNGQWQLRVPLFEQWLRRFR